MEYIGIDVHKNQSQICALREEGEITRRRIKTERKRLEDLVGGRRGCRILLEASTESEWVARCLEAFGHEVIVADPNEAPMYGQRNRRVKKDRRDAEALAIACRMGTYRRAHRTSEEQRYRRAVLSAREALVRTRVRYIEGIGHLADHESPMPLGGCETLVIEALEAVEIVLDHAE